MPYQLVAAATCLADSAVPPEVVVGVGGVRAQGEHAAFGQCRERGGCRFVHLGVSLNAPREILLSGRSDRPAHWHGRDSLSRTKPPWVLLLGWQPCLLRQDILDALEKLPRSKETRKWFSRHSFPPVFMGNKWGHILTFDTPPHDGESIRRHGPKAGKLSASGNTP